jgi:hypothetical protein
MRREASAIWGAIRMLHGVSIIAQMVMDSGAPLSTMMVSSWRIASALSALANNTASAPELAATTTSA